MNFPRFISRRISFSGNKSFSRLISRIAIAAITICLSVIILASAVVDGFQYEISKKISDSKGDIRISSDRHNFSFENNPITADETLISELKKVDGVKGIRRFATKPVILKTADQFEGVVLKGVDLNDYKSFFNDYGIRFIQDTSVRQIILSSTIANRLKIDTGARLKVSFFDSRYNRSRTRLYYVGGIYSSGLAEFDESFCFTILENVQSLYRWEEEIGGIELLIEGGENAVSLSDEIHLMIPSGMEARALRELERGLFDWIDLQTTNEYVIIGLMVIVAILNLITCLIILILERVRMVGVLKAMGSTNQSIMRIFIQVSGWIVVMGLLFGNILGFGLGFMQKKFGILTLPEDVYFISQAPIHFDYVKILGFNIMVLIVTILFVSLPAFMVMRIKPVKAIRFD